MSSIVKHTEVTDYSKELKSLLFLKTQQNTTNLLYYLVIKMNIVFFLWYITNFISKLYINVYKI